VQALKKVTVPLVVFHFSRLPAGLLGGFDLSRLVTACYKIRADKLKKPI
jgi:hypothetical protein